MRWISHGAPMDAWREAVWVRGFIQRLVWEGVRILDVRIERPRVERSAVLLHTPPVLHGEARIS